MEFYCPWPATHSSTLLDLRRFAYDSPKYRILISRILKSSLIESLTIHSKCFSQKVHLPGCTVPGTSSLEAINLGHLGQKKLCIVLR